MQIINNSQPVRKVPTLQEILSIIDTANVNAYRALQSAVSTSFQKTWNNPDYTPEQIVGSLCAKYDCTPEDLFEVHSLSQTLLSKLNKNYQPLVPPTKEELPPIVDESQG